MGQNMLPWEYIISTWDLKCAYQTPRSNIPMDDSARQMMVEKLLMEPQYHAAAHFTESFYYYDETNICQTLCGNICPDGRFLGRIIMIIGKKGTTVPDGARELFERFTLYMEQLISFHYSTFGDFARNQIHDLFQHIVNGRQADSAVQADVLKKLGWKDTDLYTVLTIQFFDDARWNTHLETTLPYLIHKLENIYPDSCAVRKDSALCWLVNRSRSGTEDDSYGFRQTLVSFLRENACSAGISAEFHDISLAFYALKEAETAYLIGKRKNPQFWYFSFDDYSMDYMIGRLQEEFPTFMLVHPAVRTLMAYDAKNNAEYTATLREYLQCGLNMTAAAEKLFIHRTTFCRRMSRIEQLTELDLQEPDTILSLLLSFRLLSN
ncbi:MAG: helix-turn-helix domain-containing protein [Lachnospiraceae bacterium]|nr:helix-turn-helix domain-containing protein [Lachnospiraceae bacterium]